MSSITSHVHVLNSKTFRLFVEAKGIVLVSFVMLPISNRCRTFVPICEQVAYIMQDHGIEFAQIDALENGETCAPFEILSFPRVMLFQGFEDIKTYRGVLHKNDIVRYLNRLLHYPVVAQVSRHTVRDFKRSNDLVVIGYVAANNAPERRLFETLAKSLHPEFIFGVSDDRTLAENENINVPAVAVYRKSEEMFIVEFDLDIDMMTQALRLAARPKLTSLAIETHENLLDLGLPIGYMFIADVVLRESFETMLRPVAQRYRQSLLMTIGNPNDLDSIVEDLHVRIHENGVGFAIREPRRNLRYPMNGGHRPICERVCSFIESYSNGQLRPTIKSEPIPPPSTEALVKVVGASYHDMVEANDKDVLLVYCIGLCGPCDALRPTLVVLAQLYASDPNLKEKVTVAIIDYDLNDVPERLIQGFPTLELFPARAKMHPVLYEGNRALKDIVEFVKRFGSHKAQLGNGVESYS